MRCVPRFGKVLAEIDHSSDQTGHFPPSANQTIMSMEAHRMLRMFELFPDPRSIDDPNWESVTSGTEPRRVKALKRCRVSSSGGRGHRKCCIGRSNDEAAD
jgi:hypothetical protein